MNVVRVLAHPSTTAFERIRARLSDEPSVRYVTLDEAGGVVEVLVEEDDFDAIREGEIRSTVLALLADVPGDEVAELRRRVDDLERQVGRLVAAVPGLDPTRPGALQDSAAHGHAPPKT